MRGDTWVRRLHRLLALPAAVLFALTAVSGLWLNHLERAGPVPVARPLARPWEEAPQASATRVWLKKLHTGRYAGTTLLGDATAALLLVMTGTGLYLWLRERR
ncbi:MAG: hypothetical protein ACUVTQ_10520 [Desulfotomaculales bacterium]